ncbi:MAG TPA: hypothetical protein VN370_02230, partial [Desulfitobacteriaceae bacterium]|nr:hypothetical protein [Desulfitobacteriaceae bacterium]
SIYQILLPLIIFLILIIIVIRFIVPLIKPKISALISWRRSFLAAGIYLGVLIIVVPLLFLLPHEDFSKSIVVAELNKIETLSQEAMDDLYNHKPLVGDLNKQKGLYQNSSHTYKIDSKKLAFQRSSNVYYQIFIDRKDVDDGEIEVSTYVTAQLIGDVDFTKLVLPPIISYQNGTLFFESAKQQVLDFKRYNADFTVAQFKKRNIGDEKGQRTYSRSKIVYIRVPKSLEIEDGENSVQIVGN